MVDCGTIAVVLQYFPYKFSILMDFTSLDFTSNTFKQVYGSLFLLMIPLIYCRKRLFSLINDLPTVFEVVTERKPIKDKPTVDSGSKSRGSTKVSVILLCKSELD
jgi:hypothetical protein